MSARVVFMGSPEFAVPSLRALVEAGHTVVLAVCQPDKPAGRGGRLQAPPVKVAAEALGIEVFQPERLRDEAVQAKLAAADADVFVIAAYGKILPQAVLDLPRHGCLNVHASLLPKWRGPSPIVAAVLAGDAVTGVSIMSLVRKMDAGPVLSTVEMPIEPGDTAGALEARLAAAGAQELARILPSWLAGQITPREQDEAAATYCHLITKDAGWLRAGMTVAEAERAVRAHNPWPGASVGYGGQRLAVWQASIVDAEAAAPGTARVMERAPAVAFADGWLKLEVVQKPGGKRLTAQQFLAGERGAFGPAVDLA